MDLNKISLEICIYLFDKKIDPIISQILHLVVLESSFLFISNGLIEYILNITWDAIIFM